MKKDLFLRDSFKVFILIIGFAITAASSANAASVTATLAKTSKSVSTAYIGNTTGAYKLSGAVGTLSKYQIEYVVFAGPNSNGCTYVIMRKIIPTGGSFTVNTTVSKSHTVAKTTLYSNKQTSNTAGATGNCIFSNY